MPIWDKLKNTAKSLGRKSGQEPEEVNPPAEPAVGIDAVIAGIDNSKAFLLESHRKPEEISCYSDALSVMQQALRGLHATVDITDLLVALDTLFSSEIDAFFSFGTSLDCNEAISTINDAIRTIAGTRQSDVVIAALQINILALNAGILKQKQVIHRYELEIERYRTKQDELVAGSHAKNMDELDPDTRNLFGQIEQRIQMRQSLIENAKTSITNINQDILKLETHIETVRCNPNALQLGKLRERIQSLIDQTPSLAELTCAVEKAQKDAAALYAEIDADIRQMREAIEDHMLPLSQQTQERLNALLKERAHAQTAEEAPVAQEAAGQIETGPDTLTM